MSEGKDQGSNLTRRVADWFQEISIPKPEMALDFSDLLAAAHSVEGMLASLVELDPRSRVDAEIALGLAGSMAALLFTELRGHLDSLEEDWDSFENRLEEFSPSDA